MNRLIIDTETTGLSPAINKVLTVGMLLVNVEKKRLKILKEEHIFVKHKHYNAMKEAMKVNKIDLKKHNLYAIPPSKACAQINSFILKNSIQETTLVGHNINFDIRFLSALFEQGDSIPLLHHQHEDTIKIWRSLQKEKLIPQDLRANLGSVAEHFKIDYTKSHDALADCHITAQVYHEMLKLKKTT